MKNYDDNAFATLLLASQITPSREELARPLSATEYRALCEKLRHAGLALGELLTLDMSGMILRLGLREEEAYRLCLLLSRTLPLSVSIETMDGQGIEPLCAGEPGFPETFARLDCPPPVLYLAGRAELFRQSAVAILGASPIRRDMEAQVRMLARFAAESGLVVIADGATSVGVIARDEAVRAGGRTIEALSGGLGEYVARPDTRALLERRAIACFSLAHPEAPRTAPHALARNKCLYVLAGAAFLISAGQPTGLAAKGALEALRGRLCDAVYLLPQKNDPGRDALLAKGAQALPDASESTLERLFAQLRRARVEQLSFFS